MIKMTVTGFIGGLAGLFSGFPIGPLLGAILAIGIVQFKTNQFPELSEKMKMFIQSLIGGSLGLSITSETIQSLLVPEIWLAALLIPILHLIVCILLALILTKFLKVDMITALCSTAPAGIGEMVLVSEKYNASKPTVIAIHLFRLLFIILIVPLLVMIV
jgi:membrane AbrB-like protein